MRNNAIDVVSLLGNSSFLTLMSLRSLVLHNSVLKEVGERGFYFPRNRVISGRSFQMIAKSVLLF